MKKLVTCVTLLFGSLFGHVVDETDFFRTSGEVSTKFERWESINFTETALKMGAKHTGENMWADLGVKFNIVNGSLHNDMLYNHYATGVHLERALLGYQIYSNNNTELFAEAGRAKLDTIFNSKVQYHSNLNGLHASAIYNGLRIHGAVNSVDVIDKKYGAILEASYSNFWSIPATLYYSFTHWSSLYDANISQVTVEYELPRIMGKRAQAYAAGLYNHSMDDDNLGMYAGMSLGTDSQAKDWLVDVCVQHLDNTCVPGFDNNSNFSKVMVKGSYNLTNELSIKAKVGFVDLKRLEIGCEYKW